MPNAATNNPPHHQAICTAALSICWTGIISLYDSESGAGGRNRFDITAPCVLPSICYPSAAFLSLYLNSTAVRAALHIPAHIEFKMFSSPVATAFALTNDLGVSMEPQVGYILEKQVDVLIYQGNLDLACNTAGNLRWANSFMWKGATAFASKGSEPWYSTRNETKHGVALPAGKFKEVQVSMVEGSEKKTRFAFVTVDRAGHLVPQDQPEVALDLLTRWLKEERWA